MNETSLEIIRMLREARLGWIADELVDALALGRETFKPFKEPGAKASNATAVEPFSADEELDLIVATLAHYFILIPRA